LASSTRIF